ncbi:hypothetical protein [Chelatococcus reniformis]|uniref:Uncharacterized protein n=1 Tax=Chelatococcus reniformis TaxID=1494448 RepID=A0A916URX3_9HYPH|nr:hypothetical protein [Chelatococcus reniformis]GGC84873.1 hypothetical protein GCM10010994_48450 [Chelatococcus reniformis]
MKHFALPLAAALLAGGATVALAQAPGNAGTMGGSANSPTSDRMGTGGADGGAMAPGKMDSGKRSGTKGPNSASDPARTDATGSIKGGPNRSTGGNPGGDGTSR